MDKTDHIYLFCTFKELLSYVIYNYANYNNFPNIIIYLYSYRSSLEVSTNLKGFLDRIFNRLKKYHRSHGESFSQLVDFSFRFEKKI